MPSRRARVAARCATLSLTAVAIVALAASPAAAHASLVSSSPRDGATLPTAPTSVSLTFDEAVGPKPVIIVTAPDGSRVDRGGTSARGPVLTTRVAIDTEGTFVIAYRVVSDDGHPVDGELTFSVGTPGPAARTGTGGGHGTARVVGMLAGLSVLGGLAVLTLRRWAPNLWGDT